MGAIKMSASSSFLSFCVAASSSLALYSTYQLWKESAESTSGEEEWDTEETFVEWVGYHFSREEMMTLKSYDFGHLPDGVHLAKTLADEAIAAFRGAKEGVPSRALDVGCAAGGISFELAREFHQVVGLDFSKAAVVIANRLKKTGTHEYPVVIEGEIKETKMARIDSSIDRDRVEFMQGDACNLPSDIGQFGCVFATNLLCRIPNPYKFLEQLPNIVPTGGVVFFADTYSWFQEASAKEFWLGGFRDANGKPVTGFDTLRKEMDRLGFELIKVKEIPFFFRDHNNRSFHTGIDHGTIWKRK